MGKIDDLVLMVVNMNVNAAEDAIKNAGFTYRIVSVDNQARVVTADFVLTRVNLYVVDKIVIRATVG